HAERLVALHDQAVADVRAEEAGERGQLVLAASTLPAEHLLPPVIATFHKLHPQLAISVMVADSQRALAMLLGRDFQLALVRMNAADTGIVYKVFAEDEIVLVEPTTKRPPSGLPLIWREEGSGTRSAVERQLRKSFPDSPTLQIGSSEAVRQAVL